MMIGYLFWLMVALSITLILLNWRILSKFGKKLLETKK